MAAKAAKKAQGPGEEAMGIGGIVLVVGYLLIVMGFVIWSLVSLWPPTRSREVRDRVAKLAARATPTPSPETSPSPSVSTAQPAQPSPVTGVSPAATVAPSASQSPSTTPTPIAAANKVAQPDCEATAGIKEGFCLDETGTPREGVGALKYFGRCWCIYDEDRLLLIVLLAGA